MLSCDLALVHLWVVLEDSVVSLAVRSKGLLPAVAADVTMLEVLVSAVDAANTV